jgi:preprotein translocase subunit SecF
MSTTTTDTAVTTPATPPRRGPGGRLYHGETSIDFYGRRWWGLGVSIALVVITLVSLFTQGLQLGIDFEGGVAWEVPAAEFTIDDARAILDQNGIDSSSAKIQTLTSDSGSRLRIQVGDQPAETVAALQQQFATTAGVGIEEVATNAVSASWGRSITEKAVRALVIFIILVALFISWRLEWRMALAAIIAMVHDVIISVGVYSVFRFEVTPATVVAFLTILGYSLYDTIVVFDKIRENTEKFASAKAPYGDVMNVSMNQVLMRSLNTSISSALPVLSLLVIGSGLLGAVALQDFAIALLVGIITGAYSSIFIATPILAMLHEREPKFRSQRGQHATGPELERLVLGGSPAGHRREAARVRQAAVESGEAAPAPIAPATPDAVLTHAPRPRKKKRR